MIIHDKVVLVTGSSEGIGHELVLRLVDKGAKVIAVSRRMTKKPFQQENVAEYNCDIRNYNEVDKFLTWTNEKYGRLDILINNAGIWHKVGDLEDISDETIADVIVTNLVGTVNMTKRMLPLLRASDEGFAGSACLC